MMKKLKLFYGFYDFANSAYWVVLQNYLLPIYFSTVLIHHWLTLGSRWLANGISTILGIVIGIIAWKIGGKTGNRIKPFMFLIGLAFLFSLILWYAIYASPVSVFRVYMIANWFYIWSLSVYNSLLTHLVDKKEAHEFSGFSWWFGYIWWAIWIWATILLQNILWDYSPFIFIFISLFYLIFSLISVYGIRKAEFKQKTDHIQTISNKSKFLTLFWYWLISESITVILLFFWTYAVWELKLSATIAWACILLVQIIGLPSTIYWSKLFNKIWERRSMNIMVWIRFITIVLLISNLWYIWLILALILWWLVIWNSQSLMRSAYSNLIDPKRSGTEFGIYWFITEIWSLVWPIIYWYMSDWLWSQKIPLLIFGLCMIIWVIILNYSKSFPTQEKLSQS